MEALISSRRRTEFVRLSIVYLCTAVAALLIGVHVHAQVPLPFVTPGPNTNVIGLTPNLDHVPDYGLKQQQEPSCIVRPSNPSYIMCAYNDLRASDQPSVQGDSWMGVSMSADQGQTWFSRLAPGYLGDMSNSLNMGFAADPSLVAIPGNSPGLAVLNYIAAFRDSNNGVLAVQRWVEFGQEDQNFWKPETDIHIISDGSEGRFIDKPAFYYHVDGPNGQGTVTQSISVEGEADPVDVTTPSGILVSVYAVFTGNGGAKIYRKLSFDNGITWGNRTKISEEQNEVTGVSISAIDNDMVIVYRRRGDNNQPDAIMSAHCNIGGNNKCSKGKVMFEMCPFDQPASGSSFRTFSFPWSANDGNRFWAVAADRRFADDNSCTPIPGAAGLYTGKPRIVGMSSVNGKDWVGADNSGEPFVVADRAEGFQVMPVAYGTKGRIDIAWYDTFREEIEGLPAADDGSDEFLINDFSSQGGAARVFRKADVYMTRLKASCSGGGPSSPCAPVIEDPVRVSQYPVVFPQYSDIGQEVTAHLPNLRLYASGTLAFKGDYISLVSRPLRQLASGTWIPNATPLGDLGAELPGATIAEDMYAAWGDNRDVEADFSNPGQLLYTPPSNANPGGPSSRLDDDDASDGDIFERPGVLVAEDEPDNSDDPAVPDDIPYVCTPGSPDFSRSRDSNVYGSLIRDEPSLVAPTPTKPLGTIQRMFPLVMNNTDPDNSKNFCLVIDNQPNDFPDTGLASFYQLPSVPGPDGYSNSDIVGELDVNAPAGSSASRAVFISTSDGTSIITVNAYDGMCPAQGAPISSVQLSDGNLFDPVFCDGNPDCEYTVDVNETHDITLVSPGLQAPVLQAPGLQAPGFQAPVLQAPSLQAPGFQAPGFQAPGLQAPSLQAPGFQAPGLQAPGLQAPSLQASTIGDETNFYDPDTGEYVGIEEISYQDVTYVVSADANVTTTYSADIALVGLDPADVIVQLIAWTPNIYTTSSQCLAQPTANQQIISYTQLDAPGLQAVNLPTTFGPTNQSPYVGEISFTGTPDKDIAITARMWVTGQARQTLIDVEVCPENPSAPICEGSDEGSSRFISFGTSAQSCSAFDAIENTNDPDYVNIRDCLNSGNEKIFQDKVGPQISIPVDFEAEATSISGAFVNFDASATDNDGTSPIVMCIPPSGSELGLGLNTVSCSAEDMAGNMSVATFSVTVVDTTPPVFTLATGGALAPIAADATGPLTVLTLATPVATDIFGVTVTSTAPIDGFPLGESSIVWTATDANGNSTTATQTVTVTDVTPPTIVAPADISQEAALVDTPAADVALGSPVATDNVGVVSITNNAPTTYPVGVTSVTWIATDQAGLSASDLQLVTMTDTTQPVITVNDSDGIIEFEATGPEGAFVDLTGIITASDKGESLPVTCTTSTGVLLPAQLGAGEYDVTCTASDGITVEVSVVIVVDVEDNVDPELTIPAATLYVDWDPATGSAIIDFLAQDAFGPGLSISATDNVDTNVEIVCDPPNGSEFAEGTTTVTCTASDDGPNDDDLPNSVTASFDIVVQFPWDIELIVPKGRKNAGSTLPIDFRYRNRDGQLVDSSGISPEIRWQRFSGQNCSGVPGTIDGDDAGSSGFRYSASQKTWQYSWQTPGEAGFYVVTIDPPGTPYGTPASECVNLK